MVTNAKCKADPAKNIPSIDICRQRNNALAESEVYICVKPVHGVHARAIQNQSHQSNRTELVCQKRLKYWVHFGMI